MKAFCTSCGAALNADTAFCKGCGAPAPSPGESKRKNRKWAWILALIVFFALGFLLGRLMVPKCPHCPAPAAGTGANGGGGGGGNGHPKMGGGGDGGSPTPGGGGGGSGTGRVMGDSGRTDGSGGGGSVGSGTGTGDMSGSGSSNVNGTVVAHGGKGSAVGADGSDDGGGGGGGKSKLAAGPNGPETDPEAKRMEGGVWRLATGAPLSTDGVATPQPSAKETPGNKVLTAADFRYDKTGLPRYPDANQAVCSAMSYDVNGRTDQYGSSSGIVTGSAFDDVVDWYRKNLPPGWSNSTISDLNRLGAIAQQLSADKIMQMLAAPQGVTPVKAAGEIPATAAADRMRLSLFKPPAGTTGDLGAMVVQQGDKPVEIFMKTHVAP
jgi:hypothetical protein